MAPEAIPFDTCDPLLDWRALTRALLAGHRMPRAQISDTVLRRGGDAILSRAAMIDGLGSLVKTATVFPGNADRALPTVNGMVTLFDDATGLPEALIDFHLVTKWKTAADSLLAAQCLARPDSRNITILGSGTVAQSLIAAYSAGFPGARFTIWSRRLEQAQALAAQHLGAIAQADAQTAVAGADIIATATLATQPVLKGAWLQPGQHVDLIGAYRADMREADDTAMARARVFVDSFDTTISHIGELMAPISAGVISPDDVIADFYQPDRFKRHSDEEITLCKNGGGAHLDLMTSRYILDVWNAA